MSASDTLRLKRIRLIIRGTVQGVGFRPYLHRLARRLDVSGRVFNTPEGVEAELEGSPDSLHLFADSVRTQPPPLASVEEVLCIPLDGLVHYTDFSIAESRGRTPSCSGQADARTLPVHVSPDISICPDCLRELLSPGDRRYRYPFINCTNCGPRYTILKDIPYDRCNTSMASFPMCPDCRSEYEDIEDRRYHAQPDCCPVCGPSCFYLDASGKRVEGDPFAEARRTLDSGGIVAVKGIGGIHLACRALDEKAVLRLRNRKKRPEKPLAIMCASLKDVRRICRVSEEEEKFLCGRERPILLLRKKDRTMLPWISSSARLGVMLPYSPIHVLLTDTSQESAGILVMTSANRPGCPVLTENTAALQALSGIADGFLLHNRDIQNRCDDSLASVWKGELYFSRRSRGYVPRPISFSGTAEGICALGAEQKASFALGRNSDLFVSPHIGDLKNMETLEHYRSAFRTYLRLFDIRPRLLVCDLHPDYFSTAEARTLASEKKLPLLQVQHHWAHMASCMADRGLETPVFGIIWDGTGLGTDETIWGGEFLLGDYKHFNRVGSIRPIPLPGGDSAIREIGRIALALLADAKLETDSAPIPREKARQLSRLLASPLPVPRASSIGRLFDGVCALITQKSQITYEGEGAVFLESLSLQETPDLFSAPSELSPPVYPVEFYEKDGLRIFDTRPLIRAVVSDMKKHTAPEIIAMGFMDALCRMALLQTRELNPGFLPVVLSGGVFQNRYLLAGITGLLENAGYSVFCHRRVSCTDEGLCLGQAAIAAHSDIFHHTCTQKEDV